VGKYERKRGPGEDLGLDERIVLNGRHMHRMVENGLNSYAAKQGQVAGYCEHGNEAASSTQWGELVHR
jgi:hypothetical protein